MAFNQTGTTANDNCVAIVGGDLTLPDANAALTNGMISWTSGPRIHNYGSDNIFIGTTAGNGTLTGTDNIAIGLNGLTDLTSGTGNMSVGANANRRLTQGSSNCTMGIASLTTATTSSNNTSVGHNSGNKISTGSGGNTGLGYQSIYQVQTGAFNTALGYQAGGNYTTSESNNICIGNGVGGTVGESGITRIGGSQTACYIDGIQGVSVTGGIVNIDTNNKMGSIDPSTSGNVLTSNGTTWASSQPGGYCLSCNNTATTFTIVDSTLYYVGISGMASTVSVTGRFWIPKSGTINACYGNLWVAGTLGTNENITISILVNESTNYDVTTTAQATAANNPFSGTGLSIPVTAGDYIIYTMLTPAFATNPSQVGFQASIYVV